MRLRAVVVTPGNKGSARIQEIPEPTIKDSQLLVKTRFVGLDGTDKEINEGLYGQAPKGIDYLVLGHEALGEVLKVGKDVKGFKTGDYIVPTVRRPGNCVYCKAGQQDMCIEGKYTERGIKQRHGYLSEKFAVDPSFVVKIPESIKEEAVLLEPMSIAEKGVRQAWKIQQRMAWQPKISLVTGMGPLGMLCAMLLRLRGLHVWMYSLEEQGDPKVKIMKSIGVNYISAKNKKVEEIPELVGKNIDFIFEATGNSKVAFDSISILGTNGVLCWTGVTGGHKKVEICADCLNLDVVLGNKLLFGTVNASIIDFNQGIEDFRKISQKYPKYLKSLITKKISIEDEQKVIETIESLPGTKNLIVF